MHSGKDATHRCFVGRSLEARERATRKRQNLGSHVELEMVFVKEGNQYFRSGGADHCVSAWIRGVRGGIADLGKPTGIGVGVRIAVRSGRADRGHRAPEIVGIFRIVEGDDPVGETQIEQRKQASALRSRQIMRQRCGLGDLVPVVLNGAVPKWPVNAWSAVAVVLLAIPSDLTCSKVSAYLSLVSFGGPPGRNWSALSRAKGVTRDQCVNWGCGGKFGGVDW